jgi:hypothetical protein
MRLPKPVWRASRETLTVPRCILRSSSRRSLSCIWVKFICGKSATSNGRKCFLVCSGKANRVVWPSIEGVPVRIRKLSSGKGGGRLTQENHISRLALLNLALAVGIFHETLHCRKAEQGAFGVPFQRPMNKLPAMGPAAHPVSHLHGQPLSRGVKGRPVKKIPGSARYEHDKKRESTGGNPPSGHEKPELPAWFSSPRGTQEHRPSGVGSNTEKQSWICACN